MADDELLEIKQQADKLVAGEYSKANIAERLARPDKKTSLLRKFYLETFDFKQMDVLQALRQFLASFVLKGETQEQDRILESFSNRYNECNSEFFNAVFVHKLVYSLILLNTDLHNKNMKGMAKMKMEQFLENTLPTIEPDLHGQAPPVELLKRFYKSISDEPIMQPEEEKHSQPLEDMSMLSGIFGSMFGNRSGNLLRNLTLRGKSRDFGSQLSLASVTSIQEDKRPPRVAPFREGLLLRKHVMESSTTKAMNRAWHDFFVTISGSDLLFYRTPTPSANIAQMMSQLKLVDFIPLRHVIASALPSPGYSPTRPYCFQLVLSNGGLHIFQAFSDSAVKEWVAVINWWAARESREPLPGSIGSVWYGYEREWLMDFVSGGAEEIEELDKNASPISLGSKLPSEDKVEHTETQDTLMEVIQDKVEHTVSEAVDDLVRVGGNIFASVLNFVPEKLIPTALQDRVVDNAELTKTETISPPTTSVSLKVATESGSMRIEDALKMDPDDAEALPEPRRRFSRVKDSSVTEWKPPLLPFVPASLSKQIEEVTLQGKSSRRFDYPLGFDADKLKKLEKQAQLWKERYERLQQDITEHLACREILKNFGVGKGIQELIVIPNLGIGKHGKQEKEKEPGTLRRKGTVFGRKDGSHPNLNSTLMAGEHDIDNIVVFAAKAKGLGFTASSSAHSLAESVNSGHHSSLTNLSRSGSISFRVKQPSQQVFDDLGDGEGQVYWHPKMVNQTAALAPLNQVASPRSEFLTPRTSSLVELASPKYAKSITEAKHTIITLPPPSNVIVHVPAIPKSILTCILTMQPLPRFPQIQAKLANRIDLNWTRKFEFLQWELCKANHYYRVLSEGVTMITRFRKPSIDSAASADKKQTKLKKRPNAQLLTKQAHKRENSGDRSRSLFSVGEPTSPVDIEKESAESLQGSQASLAKSSEELSGKMLWLSYLEQGEGYIKVSP